MSSSRAFGLSSVALGAFCTAGLIAACSSHRSSYQGPDSVFTQPDAEADAPDVPTCGLHCSRDLKTVLDSCKDDALVQTCDPNQGCGQGECVDACNAAALSKGSIGCAFWTLPPDDDTFGAGSCFAALIANTWDRETAISATYGAAELDVSKSVYTVRLDGEQPVYSLLDGPLASGQVAVLFLANDPDIIPTPYNGYTPCPEGVTPALPADPIRHGTSRSAAFQVKTDVPVSAYSIFPYGGANTHIPSATLLLPVSSWENDYIAVSPYNFGHLAKRTLQIVAAEDDTVVRMRPSVQIPAGDNVESVPAGEVHQWTLGRGETLQFTQNSLTGSGITSNRPIAVFGGSQCTYIPADDGYCDLLQQQLPPLSQWGSEYALVPFPSRIKSFTPDVREQVPYTLVAGADGTKLTYEPLRPFGAPETLDAAQSASFMTDQYLVVRSQDSKHPLYAAVYMTGAQFGGGDPTFKVSGDPDFVNVPPSDQFLDHYVFFTDHTYPDTKLTIVRRKTERGFLPVTLDCAGEVENFQALGTSGEYEFAWVTLTTNFIPSQFDAGQCGYGRQAADSEGPFSITIWGTTQDSSYAYVGGTGLRPINEAPAPLR